MKPQEEINNWEEEFFNRLANELERLFPKTNQDNPEELSKGNRTTALVLNAFANIIFKDILDKALAQQKKELYDSIWDMLIMSLPSDAENLTTCQGIPDQCQRLLKEFLKKLNHNN